MKRRVILQYIQAPAWVPEPPRGPSLKLLLLDVSGEDGWIVATPRDMPEVENPDSYEGPWVPENAALMSMPYASNN